MAQIVVGLDIGANSIKMTRLEASLFRYEFLDFSEHSLPVNVDLPWEQLVSNVLQVLFSDRDMRADKVIVSFPGRHVSTRILTFPFSDRKKLEQALPFEIEGLIPLPIEEILLDYHVLEKGQEGARILSVFTEKKLIASHLALLREAGIDPHAVLPGSVALANLWKELPSAGTGKPCAILDFGESETSLCILQGRHLRYARTWGLGSALLTQALEKGLSLPVALAREKKEKEADLRPNPTPGGDSEQEWMAEILTRALRPIVAGLRQSLLSVSKTLGMAVEELLVCGRGSLLKGLGPFLEEQLQVSVTPLKLEGPVGEVLDAQGHPHGAAATSLGLAYHALRDTAASKLNLRTGEYTYVSERAELKRQLISGGVMAAGLLLLLLIYAGLQVHYRTQEYERVSKALDRMALEIFPEFRNLPAGAQRTSALRARLERERRERDLFVPLSPQGLSVLDVMLDLSKAVPDGVKIDVRELVIEGDRVRIDGEADSYNATEQFKQNLLASGLFVNADIPEAKDSLDQTKVKFKMILQLERKIL